jgi:aerobic carbon-monoxide dehydrogenase small subunit
MRVSLEINGDPITIEVRPHWTLLQAVRDVIGLTGTKEGCGAGECGACSVLLDGRPVRSCLTLAAQAEGRRVTTIEGLALGGALHPLQEAFVKGGAPQCGFCIPGMLMVAKALLDARPDATEPEVREALSGNLCRCTGYVKPVEAVLEAAKLLKGERRP